ncbi:MAG: helix-turn-helix transcriptional regulator [Janthinobacterium lividum]
MTITINPLDGEGFLSSFAKMIGSTVEQGRVIIPENYGSGYVMGFLFGKQLRMVVRNYVLKEEILITRHQDWTNDNMIKISFHNILKSSSKTEGGVVQVRPQLPSVTITTKGFEPELHLHHAQHFNDIHLGIDAAYLAELLNNDTNHPTLKNIIANDQPLAFEQVISLAVQNTAAEITDTLINVPLHHFFYKLKAQELICYLLIELSQRKQHNIQALNSGDMKKLYVVRDNIRIDLAKVPVIAELARFAGMSESKLKRLFKQVFGKNVYEYYQSIRMNEAAFLLKNKNMSVSEVGYALGFVNLSHFTRTFDSHIGMKPKKFSTA